MIGARDLPGDLIAGCRLLRADRRPGAELTRHNGRAAIFQLGAGPSAVIKEKIVSDLDQAGRAKRFDHRRRRATDHPVAIEVLVETGLERFQRSAGSRHVPIFER